jgi:two-component system chemotaxis response regulator CheY
MRALVVDDSQMMRMILVQVLTQTGYEVCEACDGEQALAFLQQGEPIDLMMTDWNMPGMDGHQLIRTVRADQRLNPMRIFMLTMEGAPGEVQQALAAGADDYMIKPFTREALVAKLAGV